MAHDEVRWGLAAQLTIANIGKARVPPPVQVDVVSTNGTVVRSFADVTGGRGIAANGRIAVNWNGTNDEGRPVLWGTYTMRVPGYGVGDEVELLRPPHHAIEIEPMPRQTRAGSPIEFRVLNTGTTWVNGTMTVAAGRDSTMLYAATVDVRMPPDTERSFYWAGKDRQGKPPEAQKYLVAVRVEPEDGPTPFAQDVFTLT